MIFSVWSVYRGGSNRTVFSPRKPDLFPANPEYICLDYDRGPSGRGIIVPRGESRLYTPHAQPHLCVFTLSRSEVVLLHEQHINRAPAYDPV